MQKIISNRISSNYDLTSVLNDQVEDNLTIKVNNDSGDEIEILDKETGHSIATRSLDTNLSTIASGYKITFNSKAVKNDTFQKPGTLLLIRVCIFPSEN